MTQQSFDLEGEGIGHPTKAPAAWSPPDQAERNRIVTDLDRNLLVEAGAGSGKTTSMVARMVELVRAGREIDRIAAVTFTRKAAAELRERFQEALEGAFREAGAADDIVSLNRVSAALDGIDRCFLGTIHSFCARLLRERPLEAGVPPEFEEVSGADEDRLRAESWTRFLERLAARENSRLLRAMGEHGLRPAQLQDAFRQVSGNPDVRFPAPAAPSVPDGEIAAVRRSLERLLDQAQQLLPAGAHPDGWDGLQRKVRSLRFRRRVLGWERDLDFLAALEEAVQGTNKITQKRWSADKAGKEAAKAYAQEWEDFCREDGRAHRLLRTWWARRYRLAIRFARAAAGCYAADRLRTGKLTFQDLLIRAAALLRNDAAARAELGHRYRWLLVDEFQDTDPIQAEVLFVLASDPAEDPRPLEGSRTGVPWHRLTPRAGALFVVGDPKQSIYRFRRADIAVYNQVKARFREFGDVLRLTTNFRSRQPLEAFVNRVFQERFPTEETEHQAAFAPLRVRPGRAEGEGIYWYRFDAADSKGKFSGRRIAQPEAELLAGWVRSRIDLLERRPGDFMILATRKNELVRYARAMEAYGVPVQVTGAGVGAEAEVRELILLLRALADPGDGVLTLAALEGLFFGFSHQELLDHALAGGRFSFTGDDAPGPVGDGLTTLRELAALARELPADVAVAEMVHRLGILPWAAAGDLGATRAGAVVYALDALRAAARDGAVSLNEAIEILETALDEEVDAPLVPGRTDAVRVMNLHKAKGLEAPVVVLAYPAKLDEHEIDGHIGRDEAGAAEGWLRVLDRTQRGRRVIALPADWPAHEAAERPFECGEEVRRLYVAATRAGEELVIARCQATEDGSCWDEFHNALDAPGIASQIVLRSVARPEREALTEEPAAIQRRILATADRRQALGEPAYRTRSITARVHGDGPGSATGVATPSGDVIFPRIRIEWLAGDGAAAGAYDTPVPRGKDWGSAVHRALEAAARGAEPRAVRAVCRSSLLEFERPVDSATGEPVELDELVSLVERVRASEIWAEVQTARRVLVEVPFSFTVSKEEAVGLGIEQPVGAEILEGVIDLAFQDAQGQWTVIDFKTDAKLDEARRRIYEAQLQLYALGLAKVIEAADPAR